MISLCQRQILACILLLSFPSQQGSGRAREVLPGAGTGTGGLWACFGVHAALLPVAARFCRGMMLSNSAARVGQASHTDDAPVHPADPIRLSGWIDHQGRIERDLLLLEIIPVSCYFTQGQLLFLRKEGRWSKWSLQAIELVQHSLACSSVD